jgi:hypothetical protein
MYRRVNVDVEVEQSLSALRQALIDGSEVRVASDRMQRYHAANSMYDYLLDALTHCDKVRRHLAGVL